MRISQFALYNYQVTNYDIYLQKKSKTDLNSLEIMCDLYEQFNAHIHSRVL